MRIRPIPLAGLAFYFGFSLLITQIILLRTSAFAFAGNEIVIPLFLGYWLGLGGAFTALFGLVRPRASLLTYWVLKICQGTFVVFGYLLLLLWPVLTNVPLGAVSSFSSIALAILAVLAPITASFAYEYYLLSRLAPTKNWAVGINSVYALETIGALAGGLLYTFILVGRIESINVLTSIVVVSAVIVLLALFLYPEVFLLLRLGLAGLALGVTVFALTFFPALYRKFISQRFEPFRLEFVREGQEGLYALTSYATQKTLWLNGIPLFSTENPELVADVTHISVSQVEADAKVLLIHEGNPALVAEMLKYPKLELVSYVVNPEIARIVSETGISQMYKSYIAGRLFMIDTLEHIGDRADEYSLVVVNLSGPTNLHSNYYYSDEFFRWIKARMDGEGVIVLSLPSEENYLGRELEARNAVVYRALSENFMATRIVPTVTNLLFASPSETVLHISPEYIEKKMGERGVNSPFVNRFTLIDKLSHEREASYTKSYSSQAYEKNSALVPKAVLMSFIYDQAQVAPKLASFMARLSGWVLPMLIVGFTLISMVVALVGCRRQSHNRWYIFHTIFFSGLLLMVAEVGFIYAFQALIGNLYHFIAVIFALIMLGMAIGAIAGNRAMANPAHLRKADIGLAILCALSALLIVPAFSAFQVWLVYMLSFLVLPMVALIVGFQFAVATRWLLTKGAHNLLMPHTADVLGGSFGALAGGILLIPILGYVGTFIMLAAIKLISFLPTIRVNPS